MDKFLEQLRERNLVENIQILQLRLSNTKLQKPQP